MLSFVRAALQYFFKIHAYRQFFSTFLSVANGFLVSEKIASVNYNARRMVLRANSLSRNASIRAVLFSGAGSVRGELNSGGGVFLASLS